VEAGGLPWFQHAGLPEVVGARERGVPALASVACPQRSTSAAGVNQRRSSIQFSAGMVSSRQTAAGFPANGVSVKASICAISMVMAPS
jgi:hypothetical protein